MQKKERQREKMLEALYVKITPEMLFIMGGVLKGRSLREMTTIGKILVVLRIILVTSINTIFQQNCSIDMDDF